MSNGAAMMPDDVPELQGVPPDELRFWRLIEEREPEDGGEDVTLACGHSVWILGLAADQQYMYCSRCREKWDEAQIT